MTEEQTDSRPNSVSLLLYRIDTIEKEISQLKGTLTNYVPVRENELMLKNINGTVNHIESEVIALRDHLNDFKNEYDKSQIRALATVVGTMVTVVFSIIVAWITHLFK